MSEKCSVCNTSKTFQFEDWNYYCHRCAWHSKNPPKLVNPMRRLLTKSCSVDDLVECLHSMNIDFSVRRNANKYFVRLSMPGTSYERGATDQSFKNALVNAMLPFLDDYYETDYHDVKDKT